jgi:predicted XRE-type DNA-binding protein
MLTHTVIAHWSTPDRTYVVYGDGSTAECCDIDTRTPVLEKLREWVKAQKAQKFSKKSIAAKLGMPQWAVSSIAGNDCRIPTTTLYELLEIINATPTEP